MRSRRQNVCGRPSAIRMPEVIIVHCGLIIVVSKSLTQCNIFLALTRCGLQCRYSNKNIYKWIIKMGSHPDS